MFVHQVLTLSALGGDHQADDSPKDRIVISSKTVTAPEEEVPTCTTAEALKRASELATLERKTLTLRKTEAVTAGQSPMGSAINLEISSKKGEKTFLERIAQVFTCGVKTEKTPAQRF